MPVESDIDRRHLARAIELAEQGRGQVSPNPLVGAVIGRDRDVIGEGFHRAIGAPHAEVEAIRSAGGRDLDGLFARIVALLTAGDKRHANPAALASR